MSEQRDAIITECYWTAKGGLFAVFEFDRYTSTQLYIDPQRWTNSFPTVMPYTDLTHVWVTFDYDSESQQAYLRQIHFVQSGPLVEEVTS